MTSSTQRAPSGRISGRAGPAPDRDLIRAAGQLSLAAQVGLLTGADSWRLAGCPAIGLRPVVTSDGPSGVRGVTKDERAPSSCLPCGSALGATWDVALVAELGGALGREARLKGVDVLLGPTINLMRTPLGGRGFECFAEDPVLAGALAAAYVRGVQGAGVAATPKHLVGNDSETGRWGYDALIETGVLRELYLVPFEACVRDGGAWAVMAAYNRVNGTTMTEHAALLGGVLKREWGFDGVVMSDWHAARSTVATALGGLDLAMPGPGGPWGAELAAAVRAGEVSPQVVTDKVVRVLRLARRVGALDDARDDALGDARDDALGDARDDALDDARDDALKDVRGDVRGDGLGAARAAEAGAEPVDPGLLRRAAAASFVLLSNRGGTLPLDPGGLRRVTVAGPNAAGPVIQGGGSAGVALGPVSAPGAALRAALPATTEVIEAAGCQTWQLVPPPRAGVLRDPGTGEAGVRLEFRGGDGALLGGEHRASSVLAWWDALPDGIGWGQDGRIVLQAELHAQESGPHLLGAAGIGCLTLSVDGEVLARETTAVPADPVEAMTRPGEIRAQVWLTAGVPARLRLELAPAPGGDGPLSLRLGVVPVIDDETLLAAAAAAAAASDAAVVVVGSAELTESEGFDRATLALPGRQDELVRRVAAACPRTIVVVNAGMPVLMPWAGEVAAVICAWLPGQAFGAALADVLLGAAEPGGRLPVTLPAAEADAPVLHALPDAAGVLRYGEGLLIGYRGYDAHGIRPRFPFGHGLGYTTWAYEALAAAPELAAGADLEVMVTVRNTGGRPGREMVQVYVAGPPGEAGRPVRALAAFGPAVAAPGQAAAVRLTVPARAFARWDEAAGGWAWPAGQFEVQAGRSAGDLRLSAMVRSG